MRVNILQEYVILDCGRLDGSQADLWVFPIGSKKTAEKIEERVKYWCKRLNIQELDVERSFESWYLSGYDNSIKETIEIIIRLDTLEVIE